VVHVSKSGRNKPILHDLPLLLEVLRIHTVPSTELILVKASVCELLDSPLTSNGFTVLNRGKKVPFPSTGNQTKLRNHAHPTANIGRDFQRLGSTLAAGRHRPVSHLADILP
jgi:hypothetical protein